MEQGNRTQHESRCSVRKVQVAAREKAAAKQGEKIYDPQKLRPGQAMDQLEIVFSRVQSMDEVISLYDNYLRGRLDDKDVAVRQREIPELNLSGHREAMEAAKRKDTTATNYTALFR